MSKVYVVSSMHASEGLDDIILEPERGFLDVLHTRLWIEKASCKTSRGKRSKNRN